MGCCRTHTRPANYDYDYDCFVVARAARSFGQQTSLGLGHLRNILRPGQLNSRLLTRARPCRSILRRRRQTPPPPPVTVEDFLSATVHANPIRLALVLRIVATLVPVVRRRTKHRRFSHSRFVLYAISLHAHTQRD